jgi:hypothetical protein
MTIAWDHPAATAARDDNTFGVEGVPAGTIRIVPVMTPRNLAALASVAPHPATAWATGKYVRCAKGAQAHWTGTAWAAGPA